MQFTTKKLVTIMTALAALDLAIGTGQVKVTSHMIPEAFIPAVQDWASFLATLLTGAAAVVSGWREDGTMPAPLKAAAAILLLLALALLGPSPGLAQGLRKPQFTGNPIADIKAANSAKVAPQKSLTDILAEIAAKGTADLQAADDVASAIDPDSGKMQDAIAHACYPALIKFIGGLPKGPADGSVPGPAVVFERARLARKMIQSGLPDSLKIGCAPLVQDEANFFVKILALAGVAVGTGGLGGLAIPAVPGLLSAMPLVP